MFSNRLPEAARSRHVIATRKRGVRVLSPTAGKTHSSIVFGPLYVDMFKEMKLQIQKEDETSMLFTYNNKFFVKLG